METSAPAAHRDPPSAFAPTRLGALALRNRIIKAATFEGMCPRGAPSEALVEHHRRIAAGGAAMTIVAYCSVSPDGRSFPIQMWMREEIVPALRRLTDAVHREGAAAALQLGHCGSFASPRVIGGRPIAPSVAFNAYGLAFARAMSEADIARLIDDFGRAAALAVAAGFDALEIHLGHGYLLSQFLSPRTNRRRDRFGGSLENRLRLPLAVLRRVRERAGARVPLLAKMNLRDGFAGGLELDEAVEVARRLEAEGVVDALVPSGGFVSRTPLYMLRGEVPFAAMAAAQRSRLRRLGLRLYGRLFVQAYPFEEAFFLADARRVRAAVRMPVALLGGVKTLATIERAMAEGFDLVAMARALIHDPDLVHKMARGETRASGCVPCNRCIAEFERGGVRCVRAGVAG